MKNKILIIGIVLVGLLAIAAIIYFLALPIFETAKAEETQIALDSTLIDQPTFDLDTLDTAPVVSRVRSFAAIE